LLKKLGRFKYHQIVINIMASPEERIERYIEEMGTAKLQQLAVVGEVPEHRAKSIANGLVYEGKVRSHAMNQEGGAPLYDWVGT